MSNENDKKEDFREKIKVKYPWLKDVSANNADIIEEKEAINTLTRMFNPHESQEEEEER